MVSNQSSHTKEAAAVATAKLAKSKDISIILPNEQLQREEEEAYYYAYRPVVRVAGLYNTGTNTLSYAIHNNLKQSAMMGGMGPSFTGELLSKQYRVMWGKHNPVHQKYRNTMEGRQNDPRNLTLPIVIVRDPYWWIKSMCKANYDMWWNKTVGGTSCPEILNAQTLEPNEARVYYEVWSAKNKDKLLVRYPSVPDVWTSWIREYVNADFPRLFVRYEDLLFHGETVMQAISECSGVPRNGNTNGDSSNNLPYKYQMGRSKNHGKAMGLVESIERYIDEDVRRIMRWTPAEQNYTQQQALAPDLMKLFHYEY